MRANAAIIMRAMNEMPHVHATLAGLKQQTFQDFDLFAVDSGSTDGTLAKLQHHCDADHLTQIDHYVPGPVLNAAIARTHHEIIVLLNADAIPQTDWLETLLRPILENRADATFSKQLPRPDARFIVAYDYQRAYPPNQTDPNFFSAVACAFTRELWEAHPFPETGYAEDARWATTCRADGAHFLYQKNSIVEHSHNYTLTELHQKRRRQAAALGNPPARGKCLREIARDLLHAISKIQLHTIPYNIAYRLTLHAGGRKGFKEQHPKQSCNPTKLC